MDLGGGHTERFCFLGGGGRHEDLGVVWMLGVLVGAGVLQG